MAGVMQDTALTKLVPWKWTRSQRQIQVRTLTDQYSKEEFTKNAWEFLHQIWKYTVDSGLFHPPAVKALEINNIRPVTTEYIIHTLYCLQFHHWQPPYTSIHCTRCKTPANRLYWPLKSCYRLRNTVEIVHESGCLMSLDLICFDIYWFQKRRLHPKPTG